MKTITDYTDAEILATFTAISNDYEGKTGSIKDFNGEIGLPILMKYFDTDKNNAYDIREAYQNLIPKWVMVYNAKKEMYELLSPIAVKGSIYRLEIIHESICSKMGEVIIDNLNKLTK